MAGFVEAWAACSAPIAARAGHARAPRGAAPARARRRVAAAAAAPPAAAAPRRRRAAAGAGAMPKQQQQQQPGGGPQQHPPPPVQQQQQAQQAAEFTIDTAPHSYRMREPWTALALDNLRGFSVQLACAGGSGAIAKTAVAPLERVKILLQVQQMSSVPAGERYKGLVDALRRIPQREGGVRALYRGNGANVARLVPDVGLKFAVHDQFVLMFTPPDGSPLGVSEKVAAGAATGILRTLLFYPLDLSRTRLTADATPAGGARPYSGIASCLASAWADRGLRGWYQGLGMSLPGVAVYMGISFSAYDALKQQLPGGKESKEAWWYPFAKIGAGAGAGIAAQTASYPLDTLRRRMQVNGAPGTATRYRGYLHCLRHMAASERGLLRELWRGWGVNCLKTAPGAAVQFVAYDLLRLGVTSLDPSSGAAHRPSLSGRASQQGAGGGGGGLLQQARAELGEVLLTSKMNVLLLLLPLAAASQLAAWPPGVTFVLALLPLCPLAERLGLITEQLAMYYNDTLGGLLNATFGNATEVIIAAFAIRKGLLRVVKLTLLGSMVSNLLLVLGSAFLAGGLAHSSQRYNQQGVTVNAGLLVLCVVAVMLPTLLSSTADSVSDATAELALSRFESVLLLLGYALFLVFQLYTHRHLYEDDGPGAGGAAPRPDPLGGSCVADGDPESPAKPQRDLELIPLAGNGGGRGRGGAGAGGAAAGGEAETARLVGGGPRSSVEVVEEGDEAPVLSRVGCFVWLTVVTLAISWLSDAIMEAITEASHQLHVPMPFLTTIVVPIVGNAAEHASALGFAIKNRMDIAMGVALGSSTQIGVLVIPLCVMLAWALGQPLDLNFNEFEALVLFVSVLLAAMLVQDGTSHWLKGALLILSYVFISAGFWLHKDAGLTMGDEGLAGAQTVADALVGLLADNSDAVTRGAANLLFGLAAPEPERGARLPPCRATSVLLNAGGFPSNWSSLPAEQQAAHPINLVMMQLAYAAYQPPGTFAACLAAMGVPPGAARGLEGEVPEYGSPRSALVLRAGRERVFVVVKGSGLRDLTINLSCRHARIDGAALGAPRARGVALHRGFWRGWQVLEAGVLAAVRQLLADVPGGEVHVVGHSLGAATAAIAALRLRALLAGGRGRVAGVWLFAAPRSGNAAWAATYDAALRPATLRFANYQDFAVRVPARDQACSRGGSSLSAETQRFDFAHVGRQLLMCPDPVSGLTRWSLAPGGSEDVDCGGGAGVDASGATHQLGSYFDAWRRGHLAARGSDLAGDPRVAAVLCEACALRAATRLEQIAAPARPGGPVTCALDASCTVRRAFDAATAVGRGIYATAWSAAPTTCRAFMCAAA
ncbi:cation/proton exchanger 4 [Scenedesmus sp. PABB004]|nr:cation/proton exchanger 4 [Scenedesmus sp. PABB004]